MTAVGRSTASRRRRSVQSPCGEGIPLLELGDERATLEQAYLDLTADDTPFAASTTRDRQEA